MHISNPAANDYFEKKFNGKNQIVVSAINSLYYKKLLSYLLNKSFEVFFYVNEIENVVEQILKIKPSFTLLSTIVDKNELTEVTGIIREFSPRTHVIIQLPLNTLLAIET